MSRKFFISVLVILTGFSLELLAQPQQPPDTLWTRAYGTDYWEISYCVEQTPDGGFVVGGYSKFDYWSQSDMLVIKTDANGNVVWSHTYGDTVYNQECLDVKQTADSGFIFVGYSVSQPAGPCEKVFLVRTNANGDTLWTRMYGGGAMFYRYRGESLTLTPSGDYLITGNVRLIPGLADQIFLMKISANGDSLWCQYYSGVKGKGLKETSDGNYVIVGRESNSSVPYSEVILLKVDPDGNLIWRYTYGTDFSDYGEGIDLTTDGGYIITGYTNVRTNSHIYQDVLLIKTDAAGNLLWIRNLGQELFDERGYDVISVSDGYVIAGMSNASGGYGYNDVYVLKTDLAGNVLWEKYIGGWTYDDGYSITQTTDSGYAVCGYTASFGARSYNFYLVRLGPENAGVNQPFITSPSRYSLSVYPNPFNASATITFSLPTAKQVKLTIFDITGQRVANLVDDRQSVGHHHVQFDASNLSSGIYFAQLAAGESKTIRKLLLVK